jgi:hypothetical protein
LFQNKHDFVRFGLEEFQKKNQRLQGLPRAATHHLRRFDTPPDIFVALSRTQKEPGASLAAEQDDRA